MSLPIILMAGSLGTFPGDATYPAPTDADYSAANDFYKPSDTYNGVQEYTNCRNCAVYWNGAGYWIIATAPHGTGTPLYQVAGGATAIPSYGWSPVIGSGTTTAPTFALITEGMSSGGYVLTNNNGTTPYGEYDAQLVGQFLPISGQEALSNGATQYAGFSIGGYLRAVAYVLDYGVLIWMILNGLAGIGTPDPQDEAFVPINVFPTGGWTINYSPLGSLPVPTFASNIGSTLTASSDSINCSNYNTGVELDWNIVGIAGEQSSIIPIIDNGAAAQNPLGYYPASSGKSGTPINDSHSLNPPVSVVTEASSGLVNVFTFVGSLQVYPTQTTTYTITTTIGGAADQQWVTIIYPSVLVCLWLNPTALVCSDFYDGSELSWLVVGGTSQSIDQGIGAVASTGSTHVSTSVGETWTLTAQPGSEQATATLTVDPSVALPSVDGAPVLWGGGQTYLAGPYLITCCGGGYEYNPAGYSAGYGYTINGDVDYDNGPGYAVPSRGFRLFSGTVKPPALGQRFLAPGLRSNYPSAAACTTANAGQQNIFYHSGGVISLYLEDFPYWDNVLDSTMPVSFGIAGPGPVISFTESSTGPVNAGTSVTLSWAVQYSASQSIDNGIGAVSATGTTVVNPTVTTTYNLTATGTGITQIASITVYVYVPTAPTNIDMVNACGGEISLVWEPGQYGTSQILQRSTDNATWTTIATLALGVNSYVDTVTRSTQFFYKIINTDGYNPAISTSYEASAIALPLAVTNLASTTAGMVVNLSWTPIDGSSYFVYRNGDLCNTLAFVGTSYADSGGLVSGDTYTYMVQSVNQCGETANSVSITATPYYNLNAYTPVTPPTGNWS